MSLELPLLSPEIPADLTNCDLEPIHIPSLIQPHGMLLAARQTDWRIVYFSENSAEILGVSFDFALLRTLPELLGEETVSKIQEGLGPETHRPTNILTCSFPLCPEMRFDVSAHRIGGLICVEIEIATEERGWDQLSTNLEKAIRAMGDPQTLEDICAAVPHLIRSLTGYDRVMVYRFDHEGHGQVVGEEKAAEMDSFLDLRYPATDIPRQARKLFLLQRLRTIVDVNYRAVPMLGNQNLTKGIPLDMTYCGLRGVSPIHVEYLNNMGVGASLGISLIHRNELWGMIIGHHRTPRHLAPEKRALCDLLGQVISLLIGVAIQAQDYSERLAQKSMLDVLGAAIDEKNSIAASLERESDLFLRLVAADGALIRIGGETSLIGKTPPLTQALALEVALDSSLIEGVASSREVGAVFPEFASLAEVASGVLKIYINASNEGILWFRGEVAQSVTWAGNPNESKVVSDGATRLSPRKSFAVWEERQQGRSLPWRVAETDAALGLQRILTRALLRRSEAQLALLIQQTISTKLADDALRASEERYRRMADSMPQIVWASWPDGRLDYFNRRWQEFTGFPDDEVGDEGWNRLLHPDDIQTWRTNWLQAVAAGRPFSLQYRLWDRLRGEFRWHLGRALPVNSDTREIIRWYGTSTDVDDFKRLGEELEARVEERTQALRSSLLERDTLLKEVHHRVKNNLQVVCSLLSLQLNSDGESPASERLRVAYQRIQSMSLVHEQLYDSSALSDLDFGTYIEDLVRSLYESYCPDPNRVELTLTTDSMRLTIDQAIPCGLILNELVSNALKHAFPNGQNGLLEIIFRNLGDNHGELTVRDSGVGLPAEFEVDLIGSMGMRIVHLLTLQLGGRLKIVRQGGTQFTLSWTVLREDVPAVVAG